MQCYQCSSQSIKGSTEIKIYVLNTINGLKQLKKLNNDNDHIIYNIKKKT